MSYQRTYSASISGRVSGSVSYPASQSGGSTSVTLDWEEPVHITIIVDTEPFDGSIATIKRHVGVLTGSVVATHAAHVEEKSRAAMAVSEAVTKGFFSLIGSNLGQQMAEAKSKVDSLLLALADAKTALLRIHAQMEQDYQRITERSGRVFEDLDRETRARIAAVDEALFRVQASLADPAARSRARSGAVIPAIAGGEGSQGQAALQAAGVRARVDRFLAIAAAFLAAERRLARVFQEILQDADSGGAEAYLPVVYLAGDGPRGPEETLVAAQDAGNPLARPDALGALAVRLRGSDLPWTAAPVHPQVERHLTALVDRLEAESPERAARLRSTILATWTASKPAVLPS